MILNRNILFLLAFCSATPAFSASPSPQVQAPAESPSDPRIKTFAYNETNVYRLDLYLKSVTSLQFSESEEVQSILIGDSSSWEVVKLKSGNVVSLKAIVPSAATNMTIYTTTRVYTFDLRSMGEQPPGGERSAVLRTVFTYPEEKSAKQQPLEAVEGRRVNSDYMVSGRARFRPGWVQDNGRQTTFFLPANAPRPAIFKVGRDKKEALVNSRTNGNTVIVDGTSDYWVLRIGDESVCIGAKAAVSEKRGLFSRWEVAHAGR
ncbi:MULTISPECIES: TrbG/VirB9 family P-type conjugative transfer protein [unclassified Neorhizobium]|uniref:TrbG/VirB9 family P-type conjugative transfer protein n=1 Tax=unclassified Neorhizobium TaxID=2629175 RepID=UPI001FF4ABC2|nr:MULTISPECIES: TrbG/VirB9 family P-type conjugative transfer protein [unclassified Neorhizobium]MCJ9670398.1 TrbG/VirB9 family P-type conjugative transfer protein [Neorhizobium sp. SHOUNA12B]MCJ9746289.1 TrbG/VirB9 family P-type conjugative transfer protein [Neorhizobium sp. SHOUNA12A]